MSTVALPKGAWLPDRNGVLHFHRDQPAPTCKATEQQYQQERKRAKKEGV